MKTLTLIYCNDGNAGKAFAATIRRPDSLIGLRDASVFAGTTERCYAVIIMDDVQEFYRERLKRAYGDKAVVQSDLSAASLTVKHRGHGQFYVMRGDEIVAGPFPKPQALEYTNTH